MRRPRLPLLLLCLAGAIAGCGQSGPLYLPGSPSEMTTLPPAPEEATDEEEDDADDGDRE
jgi:predicted small lipoprotein YifL